MGKCRATTATLKLSPAMLRRGFWLYVWRVETPDGHQLLYVGRTGDSSSANAAPPFARMGQHLGHAKASNALRRHLEKAGIEAEACKDFELIAHGPLFPEQVDMARHRGPRDIVAALEKQLQCALAEAGYRVINTVNCRQPLDPELWARVKDAFSVHFERLRRGETVGGASP